MPWSRRELLEALATLGLASPLLACGDLQKNRDKTPVPLDPLGPPSPLGPRGESSNLRALLEVLIPAERDPSGALIVPGAIEAGAERLVILDNFLTIARSISLLPRLPERFPTSGLDFDLALQRFLGADLDLLAEKQRPLTPFKDLPRPLQEAAVAAGFEDPGIQPMLLYVRAAAWFAFLGGVTSDLGLVAAGFPPYEDLGRGIAVRGYPRTPAGRLIDAEREDLAALAAAGQLDDYSYNRAPEPTPGDDLSLVFDERGDLR